MVVDSKYVVVNRQALMHLLDGCEDVGQRERVEQVLAIGLIDAVVIRTQDALAYPALEAYSASLQVVGRMLDPEEHEGDPGVLASLERIADYFDPEEHEGDPGVLASLERIADYFGQRAAEARRLLFSGEAKLPD